MRPEPGLLATTVLLYYTRMVMEEACFMLLFFSILLACDVAHAFTHCRLWLALDYFVGCKEDRHQFCYAAVKVAAVQFNLFCCACNAKRCCYKTDLLIRAKFSWSERVAEGRRAIVCTCTVNKLHNQWLTSADLFTRFWLLKFTSSNDANRGKQGCACAGVIDAKVARYWLLSFVQVYLQPSTVRLVQPRHQRHQSPDTGLLVQVLYSALCTAFEFTIYVLACCLL